jgi:DNA-directed RNA polymerase specialized sigma24 family protein
VQLRFFLGADLGEIAVVLGCPEGTVKSRLFHAIRKLAAMEDLRETVVGTTLGRLI